MNQTRRLKTNSPIFLLLSVLDRAFEKPQTSRSLPEKRITFLEKRSSITITELNSETPFVCLYLTEVSYEAEK